MSNQTTYKPGHNQSGIGLPVHGILAHIHAIAYVASTCPQSKEYTNSLQIAVLSLQNYGTIVCREVERIRSEIQKSIEESNERSHE